MGLLQDRVVSQIIIGPLTKIYPHNKSSCQKFSLFNNM